MGLGLEHGGDRHLARARALGLQRGLQRAPVGLQPRGVGLGLGFGLGFGLGLGLGLGLRLVSLQPRGVVAADVRVLEAREGERLAQHSRRVVLLRGEGWG